MFNFVDALRKKTTRREKKEFDFSRNYNAYGPTWKKVQEAVANANKGAANPRHSAELKKHLRAMLHLVVNERKGQVANPHLKDISLPCFEHMLNREQKVINKLCSYAKGSTVDSLIILHHIADLVLLSAPLLGHYKMATSPLLELLKYIESRLQLRSWRESPSETKAQDHHTRCLSHGFIQLVYCIALQVRDLKSSVQYLFELQGTETHFLLLDFALPYLHRTDEVVTAGEIDYASDLSEADQVYQIYTSEVAIDVLACVFSFQDDAVEYYLMQKREDIAKQVLKNTAFVCKKLLTASKEEEYNEDEYDSKGRFFQQLEHRLELLRIVALHPKMPFRDEVAKAFKEFIVIPILRDRLEAEEDALETVVILTGYILQNLNLVPYSDAILNILLGIEGERDTIKTKLLTALSSNDADLVPAVLKLFYTMLKVRPILVANHLIAPHLYWLVKDHGLTEFSKPIIGAIDGLFHPALFTSKDSEKTAQDQQNAQLALQQAVAQNLCSATVISPVSWTPEAPAETVHLTAEQRQLQLPVLLVERFSTVLMQPFDVTLVLLDILTLLLHLNSDALTWFLLSYTSKKEKTLVQALQTVVTVVEGHRQELSEGEFALKLRATRDEMGIRSERRGAGELTETSETMMFKTAATLEEWRREIKATLQFIVSCDLMNQQAKTAVQTPTEDDESDDDTPRRPYIRS